MSGAISHSFKWCSNWHTAIIHDEGSHYIPISVLKKPITNTKHSSTLTKIVFVGLAAPQKLKAACPLIAAPNSSVKLVGLWSNTEYDKEGLMVVLEIFLEEMLSTRKGGSYQALQSIQFDNALLHHNPSIKKSELFLGRCELRIRGGHM